MTEPIAKLTIPESIKNYLKTHKPKWIGVHNPKNCIVIEPVKKSI